LGHLSAFAYLPELTTMATENALQLAQEVREAQDEQTSLEEHIQQINDARALYEGETSLMLKEAVKKLGFHWVLKELAVIHVEEELTPKVRAGQMPVIGQHWDSRSRSYITTVNNISIE
jgi:predicted anti-sigma-YlaC factor YlaD